ncbi:hypothetical protein T484DRAFT_1808715 [Baffinella frigidus]|nr:hypothetical protein T484DRAFT_1808715 [Cryptophyta sp. CCMP2293]
MSMRAAVAVLGATLLAACVIFGQSGERVALLTSGMAETSTGSKDVLTMGDFVPLGGAGSAGHMSKAAQNEL